jgi:putative ATP-binding cassette transporter
VSTTSREDPGDAKHTETDVRRFGDTDTREKASPSAHRSFFRTLPGAYALSTPYFVGDRKWRARGLLGLVVFLCGLTTALMVVFSFCQRDMTSALSEKDAESFYKAVKTYVCVIAVAAPLFALYGFAQERFALEWRVWLTESLLTRYFRNELFFKIKGATRAENTKTTDGKRADETNHPAVHEDAAADNPEQRICEDVRFFTRTCATLLTTLIQKISSCCAFFRILWNISPTLVYACFGYSLFGTLVTSKLFANALTGVHKQCAQAEGRLRTQLLRIRDHAEPIAFGAGGAFELARATAILRQIFTSVKTKLAVSFGAGLVTNLLEFATFAVPSLVVAPKYFQGTLNFGDVTQAGYAFRQVQGTAGRAFPESETTLFYLSAGDCSDRLR